MKQIETINIVFREFEEQPALGGVIVKMIEGTGLKLILT